MAYKKFKSNDIFYNTLQLHPECDFIIYDSKIYLNSKGAISGAFVSNAGDVPTGHVSLYEINVDRGSRISGSYPFITKNGSKKYTVKQIKEFDFENFFYMCLGFTMIFILTSLFIYYSI